MKGYFKIKSMSYVQYSLRCSGNLTRLPERVVLGFSIDVDEVSSCVSVVV